MTGDSGSPRRMEMTLGNSEFTAHDAFLCYFRKTTDINGDGVMIPMLAAQ